MAATRRGRIAKPRLNVGAQGEQPERWVRPTTASGTQWSGRTAWPNPKPPTSPRGQ
jgi:hypothetical protein